MKQYVIRRHGSRPILTAAPEMEAWQVKASSLNYSRSPRSGPHFRIHFDNRLDRELRCFWIVLMHSIPKPPKCSLLQ